MKLPTVFQALIAGIFLLSGDSSALATAENEAPQPSAPPQMMEGTLTGNYLSSRFAHQSGDLDKASEFIEQVLQKDPNNQQLLQQAFRARLAQGDIEGAVKLAGSIKDAEEDTMSLVNMVRMFELVKKGDFATAAPLFEKAPKEGFNAILYPLIYAWLEVGEGKVAKPVILEDVASSAGNFSPFVYYHLALINDLAGFKEAALTYYQKAINGTEKMPYRLVEALGNFYDREGAHDKAVALYKDFMESNPETIGFADDDAQALANATSKKPSTLRLIPSAAAGIAELYYTMGSIVYGTEASVESLVYIRSALYLKPNFPQAQLMLGSIQAQNEEYAEAIKTFNGIDKNSPYYLKGQIKAAYALHMQGQTDPALKQLDALTKQYSKQYESLYTKGDILRNQARFAEAARTYDTAITRAQAAGKKSWALYFVRGVAYDRLNNWPKAEADLQKALELAPTQPDVLNYLGYSWLLHGKSIDKAKGMIEKAMEARPDDAQIIDSMGWALYHVGDFESAKDYLEQAIDLMPSDPTVNDHLGDVYWRLNRKTEAKYQWQRALTYEPEPKDAAAIRNKVEHGLPAFVPFPAAKSQTAEKKSTETTTDTVQ